jgi:hypothetical protein
MGGDQPLLPNKPPKGDAARRTPGFERQLLVAADRRVVGDILERYGPRLTRVNRFKRWRTVALMPAVPGDRFVEYPRALASRRPPRKDDRSRCLVRSWGGPITEIRARLDSAGVPIALKLTEGQELHAV